MSKRGTTILESITKIESKETGMTIEVYRTEQQRDFDHELNKKVMDQIIREKHPSLYDMAEKLLELHRVQEVVIKTAYGHGCRLFKLEEE